MHSRNFLSIFSQVFINFFFRKQEPSFLLRSPHKILLSRFLYNTHTVKLFCFPTRRFLDGKVDLIHLNSAGLNRLKEKIDNLIESLWEKMPSNISWSNLLINEVGISFTRVSCDFLNTVSWPIQMLPDSFKQN